MLLEKSIIINLLCELLRLAIACAVPRGHKRNEAHLSGFYAYAALREIVTMMSANIIDAASLTIPLYGNGLTEADVLANSQTVQNLQTVLAALQQAVSSQPLVLENEDK